MRESAHAFFRGTAPHFHARVAHVAGEVPASPLVWCCGDLHLENVGAYRGANRLTYFDIAEVDEGALAPVAWELLRLATSIRIAARTSGLPPRIDDSLVHAALGEYGGRLTDGSICWIERSIAKGVVGRKLDGLEMRSRKQLVRSRTTAGDAHRVLRHDDGHALAPSESDRAMLAEWFGAFREGEAARREWELLDVARRVTGVGSLGLPRWTILVRADKVRLFDVKACGSSSLAAASATLQPGWPDEASRVTTIARRLPAAAAAWLAATRIGETDAVVRELQPARDRLSVADLPHLRAWQEASTTLARLAAWAHLRAAGRQGADRPDALSWWGREVAALEQISRLSRRMADDHLELWHEFREME